MTAMENTSPTQLGLDSRVVGALSQLFVAGERSGLGLIPHVLTGNGVRIGIDPGAHSVSLSFGDSHCLLDPIEARELATMATAAAEAVLRIESAHVSRPLNSSASVDVRVGPAPAISGPKAVAAE